MPQDMRIPELLLDAPNIPGTGSPYPPEPPPSEGRLGSILRLHGDRGEPGRFILPQMTGSINRNMAHQTILQGPSIAKIRKRPEPAQQWFPPARPGEPQQVAPAPLPPQQQPMRSVLKR